MQRILAIGGGSNASWHVSGFEWIVVSDETEALLHVQSVQCITVKWENGPGTVSLLQKITQRLEGRGTPVLVVGDSSSEEMVQSLDGAEFDGLIDTRWSTDLIVACVESTVHRAACIAQASMGSDLSLAATIEALFLPSMDAYSSPHVHIAGYYRPAIRCGGDWWSYQELPNGSYAVLVGDVTGHGMGSAMVTAAVASTFRTIHETKFEESLPNFLARIHFFLRSICDGYYRMSMAAVIVDPARQILQMWSAGAPPLLVLKKSGDVSVLSKPGFPLGDSELQVGEIKTELDAGDRILLYTDGLPEHKMPDGRRFGARRVIKILKETRGNSAIEARKLCAMELEKDRTPPKDDITFVFADFLK